MVRDVHWEVRMTHHTAGSLLLDDIIEEARNMRGEDFIPFSTRGEAASRVIQSVDTQYRDIKKSGAKIGYGELLRRICEAKTFSDDPEENWVLQYAYQIVAMMYFGRRSKKKAQMKRDYEQYLVAQEEQESGRECL